MIEVKITEEMKAEASRRADEMMAKVPAAAKKKAKNTPLDELLGDAYYADLILGSPEIGLSSRDAFNLWVDIYAAQEAGAYIANFESAVNELS